MLTFLATILLGMQTGLAAVADGVVADSPHLPPANSAWKGEAPHFFLDRQATLFCGSHGVFSGGGQPPRKPGETTVIQYGAVFTGTLEIHPPLSETTRSFRIDDPIRMTERLTLSTDRGPGWHYDTELTALVFSGTDFPPGVSVRESSRHRSVGKASIRRMRGGKFRIASAYEVWLEISVDGGRSWHPASAPVTMKLAPEVKTATLSTRPIAE